MIRRLPDRSGLNTREPCRTEIEFADEGIDSALRTIGFDVVLQTARQEQLYHALHLL